MRRETCLRLTASRSTVFLRYNSSLQDLLKNIMKKFYAFTVALSMMATGTMFAEEQAVFDQPDGELRTYHGFSHGISLSEWGFVLNEDHDGLGRKVVFSDNGDVWFMNPISNLANGHWVKGHLENGKITLPTPILLEERTMNDGTTTKWYLNRFVKTTVYDEKTEKEKEVWVPDTEKTGITYEYTADDRIVQTDEGKPVMLGLMVDGEFMHYGDYGVEYTRLRETPCVFPEDADVETWSFKGFMDGDYATQVKVAISGDEFYMSGFWNKYPETICKGRIENGKIVIPTRQYLGYRTYGTGFDYYTFMVTGYKESGYNGKYVTDGEDLEFAYDTDAKTITSLNAENDVLMVRNGMTVGCIVDRPDVAFSSINMKYIDHIAFIPDIVIKTAYVEPSYGHGRIGFDLAPYDSEENALNPNLLSYSLWLDDEILVFDKEDPIYPDTYEGIDEPITEIPYTFDNDYGITSIGSYKDRTVMFFKIGFNEIGVQAFYDDDISGKRIQSNITYYDINNNTTRVELVGSQVGVDENIASGDIVGVNYYNVSGQPVSSSYKGIVIKETRFEDGTSSVSKTVRK